MTLEIREVEIRSTDADARTVTGIAAPYGQEIEIGGFRERFERGAFGADLPDAALFYGHDHRSGGLPIGRIIAARDTEDGYEVTARLSDTTKANEVHALLRDGVLTKFSVGFEPVETTRDGDTFVRTSARLREVSVVPFPAYSQAQITAVREDPTNVQEDTVTEIHTAEAIDAEARSMVEDLTRRVAVLAESNDRTPATSQFRSAGEILKALATNDDAARAEFRDFGTSVEADIVRPAWIDRPLKMVEQTRRVTNLFATAPLPESGNSVEYPVVKTTTGDVAAQAAEGDALAYLEVALDTATATVGTYGGYSSLSRQSIERSDLAYLDAVLRFQALSYAKVTEARTRAILAAATGTGTGTLATGDAAGWLAFVIDATADIEDDSLGLTADFMLVSRDVFKSIVTIVGSDERPVFAVNGDGANTVGSANIVKASANIGGLPVVVDSKLAANSCYVASAQALTTLESAGAPFRLQDESIVNLTRDFSLYGYLSHTLNDAKGIVKGDVDLVA